MNWNPLNVVADRWRPKLSPSELKIAAYLYGLAAETPDRRVSKSIREIAEATGLARRTVQPTLQDLNHDERRVIRILSKNKEKTRIEILLEHWPSPVNKPEPVVKPQRSSFDSLAEQAMENRIIPAPEKVPQQPARVIPPTKKPIPELFRELTCADATDEDLKALAGVSH
jgi:hypothetical protein